MIIFAICELHLFRLFSQKHSDERDREEKIKRIFFQILNLCLKILKMDTKGGDLTSFTLRLAVKK